MEILKEKIREVRPSIVAIGFKPRESQVTIVGSGFSVSSDGKILSAAHIYNQIPKEYIPTLVAMVMTKQEKDYLEHYAWLPLKFLKKDDKNDVALFQVEGYENTLLAPLQLGDSEKIEVGDEVYFIGFPYAAQLINDGFGITLIVNRGIVANIKRDGIDPARPRNFIIVDAVSNPGNSGCPLIDVASNNVVGIMSIAFRTKSQTQPNLDIREPMHISAAKPINLAREILK